MRAAEIARRLAGALLALATLAGVAAAEPARGPPAARRLALEPYRRHAIVVGSRLGAASDVPLRFAHDDARAVARVLRELGGVRQRELTLLLDPDARAVGRAFAEVAARIASSRDPALLVFYYSGHADGGGLHLGPTTLSWAVIDRALRTSPAVLRLALVDACQAGSLTAAKGFLPGAGLGADPGLPRGNAFLVAASSTELAQESVDLGGSVFTHFLVSALRGAADADGDALVTLAEANAYATRLTRAATTAWAPRVQHPRFELDIAGHGEVVLADLGEGAARVAFARLLEGHVVVIETASRRVVVEADKRAGAPLTLALAAGRYQVHLRRRDAVLVADLEVPWGGVERLDPTDFGRHSYQEVAMKGGVVELHRVRLRGGPSAQAGLVRGLGVVPGLRLGAGLKLGELELGLRAGWARTTIEAIDTRARTDAFAAGVGVTFEIPRAALDWRLGLLAEAQVWQQAIERAPSRTAVIPGAGLELGVRIPVSGRWFAELALEGWLNLPPLEEGRSLRASLATAVVTGWVL